MHTSPHTMPVCKQPIVSNFCAPRPLACIPHRKGYTIPRFPSCFVCFQAPTNPPGLHNNVHSSRSRTHPPPPSPFTHGRHTCRSLCSAPRFNQPSTVPPSLHHPTHRTTTGTRPAGATRSGPRAVPPSPN